MLAVGLMSGTSLDGIDAALIETDGEGAVRPIAFATEPYTRDQRRALGVAVHRALEMTAPGGDRVIRTAELMLTDLHAALVRVLLDRAGVAPASVTVVGFHGQTLAHRPDRAWTWQIGDAARLAAALGIAVVDQFRIADVAAGGQGAPLLPVYHRALCAGLEKPVAVLNLGGVANVTWIGEGDDLVALDTGPANGLVDHWVENATGQPFDDAGRLAAAGTVHLSVLDAMLDNPWFDLPPPKSLDRHDFTDQPAIGLSLEDGAATLTAFTAATVALAIDQLPARPRRLLVAGGRSPQPCHAAHDRRAVRRAAGAGRPAGLEWRRAGGGGVRLHGRADPRGPADQLSRHDRRAAAADRRYGHLPLKRNGLPLGA